MKKEEVIVWARRSVGAALAISYVMAIYAIIRLQIIPAVYLWIAIPLASAIIALLCIPHFKKVTSVAKNAVLIIASLLLIALNVYIFSATSATTSFINSIQEDNNTYEEYSIIAKKDQHIKLDSNATLRTSLLATDTNSQLVKAEVSKKTKADYKDYNELTSLTVGMNNKETDVAAIKSSYVQLLQENNPAFYQSIEILATFTIKVKATNSVKTDITKPFVLYISGIDTYGSIGSVSRSDVNILVAVNPKTHKILLVNTPRDYYVQLHGTTGARDKLTHAGIYGIDTSVTTLEDLYGIDINYYLRVNFASLTKLVDSLGGVNVLSDYTFNSAHYSFTTGYNQLDGKQALEFSRTRYAFVDGDRTRGENQQRVIEAIIRKLSRPEILINYQSTLASLKDVLQTNASPDTITALMNQQMNSMEDWQINSISVDGTGKSDVTYSMGNTPLYVMEPDLATLNAAKQKIRQHQQ